MYELLINIPTERWQSPMMVHSLYSGNRKLFIDLNRVCAHVLMYRLNSNRSHTRARLDDVKPYHITKHSIKYNNTKCGKIAGNFTAYIS